MSSALHLAIARTSATATVANLLENGADPNEVDMSAGRQSALHVAAESGQTEVCSLLLAAKADPAATDECDRTPLHVAAAAGHATTSKILLLHGADPFARSALPGYPSSCCCSRFSWACRSWCCAPTPLDLVRDDGADPQTTAELRSMLRREAACAACSPCRAPCWQDPLQIRRLQAHGARALAQRHALRPSGRAGERRDLVECVCGCTLLELFVAMACCCLDEHFGLDEGNAARGLRTPHWRRRIDDDPLLELFSTDERAVHVQSPTPSEEAMYDGDGRLPRAVEEARV